MGADARLISVVNGSASGVLDHITISGSPGKMGSVFHFRDEALKVDQYFSG